MITGPQPAPPYEMRSDAELLKLLLPASVFLSGAVVMVLEVLGTRLISPVYGTSLYVWSALIAVTLLSLSVGYWLGGILADRRPQARGYFLVFELAALLIAALPLIRVPVLRATPLLGLRGGALAAATIFLAAPLTLLGTISPYAVRLAANLITTVGRTAGRLYAISTTGSLLGTLLAGFWLIPHFRVQTIFFGAAVALLVPAVAYQLVHARRHLVAALIVVLLLLFTITRPLAADPRLALVHDSHFGQIKVLDQAGSRTLLVNGAIQTQAFKGSSTALSAYVPTLVDLAWRARPGGKRALVIGLGGGVIPPLFATLGVSTRTVEIDASILDIARRYFAFDERRFPVVIEDGRHFLAHSADTYDYVVLDAFAGEVTPVHLLTREMMELIDQHLAPGGVVVINYPGYREGEQAKAVRSVARTVATRFPWVEVYPAFPVGRYGNNVVLAAREPHPLDPAPARIRVAPRIRSQVGVGPALELDGPALVLTDDYNPLDLWAVEAHEAWRRAALERFSETVLLAE